MKRQDIDFVCPYNHQKTQVSRQVLAACCQTLRQKVLSKITSNDLNTVQVQLERLGAEGWDDITNDVATTMQVFSCAFYTVKQD